MGSNPASAADRPIYKIDNDASGLALSLVPPQSAGKVTLAAETSVDLTPQSWQVVPRINHGDRTVFRVAPSADPRRFIRFRICSLPEKSTHLLLRTRPPIPRKFLAMPI
jgi:hypothetical protein